jgi:hypothetical protein
MGLLLLSSVSKYNMWSYYDWIDCCCYPSVNTICGRVMIWLSLLSFVSKHNQHIVFTDGRQQQQLKHNTTTYCVY